MKLFELSEASPLQSPPGIHPKLTRRGEFTAPPDPQLKWMLLHLQPLHIVCNSMNI